MSNERKSYPSDVTSANWNFCLPYLVLLNEGPPQREYALRELFNGLRWLVRTRSSWRLPALELPPWPAVSQQPRRWVRAACFETLAEDLRTLAGRASRSSAVIVDSRTIQSTPESGGRADYDGAKKRKGSKVPVAVDTLGHLLALKVTTPTSKIGSRWNHWRSRGRLSPEKACNWRM